MRFLSQGFEKVLRIYNIVLSVVDSFILVISDLKALRKFKNGLQLVTAFSRSIPNSLTNDLMGFLASVSANTIKL